MAVATVTSVVPSRSNAPGLIEPFLRPTPQCQLGPYYPVGHPTELCSDLTRVAGSDCSAAGQVITLSGRVLRTNGSAVDGATITVWHANHVGRYAHPMDCNPAPVDPGFRGVGVLRTDTLGRWRLRTIKPSAYPDLRGGMRTPHIHFEVATADYLLVTQMYFPGESLTSTDLIVRTLLDGEKDLAASTCRAVDPREPGVLSYEWDIVLRMARA